MLISAAAIDATQTAYLRQMTQLPRYYPTSRDSSTSTHPARRPNRRPDISSQPPA